ncbi:hypothetical protein [Marisediminicola sp. LYQ85]|uniref:hypothetical protein n=1 Tax=Marisediminicola sp. LYQ85 TaxID=3391062 RepID=UPI003983B8CE
MSENTLRTRALTIACVPASHPYVENTRDPGETDVVHLPDPPPVGGASGRWWPPAMLTAGWISQHAAEFDVLHVHFGMESFETAELSEALDALERAGRPLVFTLHDLINPQLDDQSRHDEQIALVVGRADEIITLTAGAAAHVSATWGRSATVIAHPHIVPVDRDEAVVSGPVAAESLSRAAVVGVHLRDLRPNIAGVETVGALTVALEILAGRGIDVEARVDLNARVRDEAARDEVRRIAEASPRIILRERDRLDDSELEMTVSESDVALLPYRHGTHSGWVELCFDLGVPVVGADIGFLGEQHPDDFLAVDLDDPVSLAAALEVAVAAPHTAAGSQARLELVHSRRIERRAARRRIAREHRAVYERAVAARPTSERRLQ